LRELNLFIANTAYSFNKSYAWSRGNNFDFPIIEDLYNQTQVKQNFNNWRVRDIRTYIDVLTGSDDAKYELDSGVPKEFIAHHPSHDCILDILKMKEIVLKKFGKPSLKQVLHTVLSQSV
jgi:hypothetical protein